MHCECCDALLTDFEATRKDRRTGAFLDLCQECFSETGLKGHIPTIDRRDLLKQSDIEDIDSFMLDNDAMDNHEW